MIILLSLYLLPLIISICCIIYIVISPERCKDAGFYIYGDICGAAFASMLPLLNYIAAYQLLEDAFFKKFLNKSIH